MIRNTNSDDEVRVVAVTYVEARIALTECMQRHFRRLCNKCKYYGRCSVYAEYIDAWMELQRVLKE